MWNSIPPLLRSALNEPYYHNAVALTLAEGVLNSRFVARQFLKFGPLGKAKRLSFPSPLPSRTGCS